MSGASEVLSALEEAVRVAYRRGARDWTRRKHPEIHARLAAEPSPERDRPILSEAIKSQFEALGPAEMAYEIANRAGGFLDTETPDREAWVLRHLEALAVILAERLGGAEGDAGAGLRGKIVHLRDPAPDYRGWHYRNPEGYVIVAAKRADGPGDVPGPLYYTLVNDKGEVETLLSTLFTRDRAATASSVPVRS